jgi:beta-aspartyl-peptidase (threonine type)
LQPALVVHGGAWNIPNAAVRAHAEGVRVALEDGWNDLLRGASALDVVERVVRILEDDPTFNAGTGAHLNRAGRVELDASIMEGSDLRAGAVAAIEGVRHPVSVARRVMEKSEHVLLVADGARAFARKHRCELCRTRDLLVGRELERYLRIRRGERKLVDLEFRRSKERPHGTVGAVACDREGRLAAATSTGGTQDKAAGRVGDTPIVGAGTYADDRAGAASSTGWGEGILRVVLAKSAVDRMGRGVTPAVAGRAAMASLSRVHGHGGVILLDRSGRAAAVFSSPRMARGIATARGMRVLVEAS